VKRHRVVWSNAARGDVMTIVDFIAADSGINADKALERLEARARSLDHSPERGRIVPELRWHGILGFKELQEPPWRIVYHHSDGAVIIVGVFDGRRHLADVLIDRVASG
jgi:toxin ParE1/3/4